MTSEELNKKIAEVCDDEFIGFDALGGKVVPYIGWFWRQIDFDDMTGHSFGILPVLTGLDPNDSPRVGFMANNKWGYEYVEADATEWATIKDSLIVAVQTKSVSDFKTANDLIQALLKKVTV